MMERFNSTQNVLIGIFNEQNIGTLGLLSVIFTILFLSNYSFIRRTKKNKLPPGPTGIPIFGYLPFLGNEPYKTLDKLSKKYGNVFGFHIGRNYVVVCNDWESKKDAFSKIAVAYRPPDIFDAIPYGLGFASVNGQEWNDQRRYTMKIMKDIGLGKPTWEEMLQDEVKDTLKTLEGNEGNPVSMNQLFSSCFTNSVLALLLGKRPPYNHPSSIFLSDCMDDMTRVLSPMSINFFFPTLSRFLIKAGLYGSIEDVRKLEKFSAYIKNAVDSLIQDKDNCNEISFSKLYNEAIENNKRLDLKNSFTETSLYANNQSLLLASSDTNKNATIWLLMALAENPDIQKKVHEELDLVIGREGSIKWSDRRKVPYVMACILESLRWRTLVPINALRMTNEDIEILGHFIPKGSYIAANNWAIHREAKYWPNPEKFDPERFLVDGQLKYKLEAFTPFSNGKRNCPGEHIALISILQYFTGILQKFKVLPEEGREVKYEVFMGLLFKPKDVRLRFVNRE